MGGRLAVEEGVFGQDGPGVGGVDEWCACRGICGGDGSGISGFWWLVVQVSVEKSRM